MSNTQPLQDFWEAHGLPREEPLRDIASPLDSPTDLKYKPVRRQFSDSNGQLRNRSASDATILDPIGQCLSPFHPALSLPDFIDGFGPLIFPLYRASLLRRRILLIGQAPVEQACNYGMIYTAVYWIYTTAYSCDCTSLRFIDHIEHTRVSP